ncbi:hypothetical protein MuYL_1161 [Mucilaginibacter xinganensis]|uniref:Uncharacterized protein n=1 Tax=Mucilaginibacter xinganensis TaxID=1234841 RepID=A0A223NU73_9SPHI|nr:hypothetical protein MuYL_1161 [Mucilaginibacter xinganensis]
MSYHIKKTTPLINRSLVVIAIFYIFSLKKVSRRENFINRLFNNSFVNFLKRTFN